MQPSERIEQIGLLLDQGMTRRQIAERVGVSNPRITQIIRNTPELIHRQRRPELIAGRLRSYREDLLRMRTATLRLAHAIRRDLRVLDEELEAYEIDKLLGLRVG